MLNDVEHDLEHWKSIARHMAEKYERNFKVVEQTWGHAYVVCPVETETSCTEIWRTDLLVHVE